MHLALHYTRCWTEFGVVLHAMSFFSTASSSTAPPVAADKDIEVADPPADSISSLAFSPQAEYLAVGSWDNNVRSPLVFTMHLSRANHYVLSLGEALRGWC